MVAVNLWYHVGSKNERPGRTGFAHLFEHLMFEGSKHHDSGYFEPLQRAGGLLNGSTNTDRTNYWEVVPTGRARTGAVHGVGSDGVPAAGAHRGQVLEPARRGAERAAPELREPALRPGRRGAGRRAVSAGSPVSLDHHRRSGRPARGLAGRREDVLRDLLPPGQRVADAGGRHRDGAGAGPGRALLRRDSARAGAAAGECRHPDHRRAVAAAPGSRRAAPVVSQLALAGDVPRR